MRPIKGGSEIKRRTCPIRNPTINSDLPDPSVVGQAYPVGVTVTAQNSSPTGPVLISDSSATCRATLSSGAAAQRRSAEQRRQLQSDQHLGRRQNPDRKLHGRHQRLRQQQRHYRPSGEPGSHDNQCVRPGAQSDQPADCAVRSTPWRAAATADRCVWAVGRRCLTSQA